MKKNPDWSEEMALKKASKVTIPERVYRERIPDSNALVVIYLIDAQSVFLQEEGQEDSEMETLVETEGIDLNIPLVGYAIGIPPIDPDPGGTYVKGDYDITDDEDEEVEEADDGLPSDYNE